MGANESSPKQEKIYEGFNFLETEKNHQIFGPNSRTLQNKQGELAVFYVQTLTISQIEDAKSIAQKQLQLIHDSLIKLIKFEVDESTQTCSNQSFKLKYLFQYVNNDLQKDWNKRVKNNIPYEEDEIFHVLLRIIAGLAYMSEKRFLHGEICPEKIFITPDGKVVLMPNGIIQSTNNLMSQLGVGSSEWYLSPKQLEIVKNKKQGQQVYDITKSDLFSLGVVSLQLCLLQSVNDIYQKDQLNIDQYKLQGYLNKIKEKYSENLASFIEELLEYDESKRKNADQFFTQLKEYIEQGSPLADMLYSDKIKPKSEQKPKEVTFKSPEQSPMNQNKLKNSQTPKSNNPQEVDQDSNKFDLQNQLQISPKPNLEREQQQNPYLYRPFEGRQDRYSNQFDIERVIAESQLNREMAVNGLSNFQQYPSSTTKYSQFGTNQSYGYQSYLPSSSTYNNLKTSQQQNYRLHTGPLGPNFQVTKVVNSISPQQGYQQANIRTVPLPITNTISQNINGSFISGQNTWNTNSNGPQYVSLVPSINEQRLY